MAQVTHLGRVAHGVVDDATAVYILEIHKSFEDLRQVASQLAGLLVLAASGASAATPDHAMLQSAETLSREAVDAVRHIRPTPRAQWHHRHMMEAAAFLQTALSAARRDIQDSSEHDSIMKPLRTGYQHLERAAEMLPGFELVSFEQACCAR